METYNKDLKDSEKVELIHVSYDREDDAAEQWAKKEKMTWLTVLGSDRKASKMSQFSASDYVPEYRLLDASGREVATGKEAIAKAAELAK